MSRREDRMHCFSLVYQIPFFSEFDPAERMALYFTEFADMEKVNIQFIKDAVHTIFEEMEAIDSLIKDHLKNWHIERLSKIDLALLRLAVGEMLYLNTPKAVAVNEVVELAKEYSDDDAHKFINGVLGGVVDALETKEEKELLAYSQWDETEEETGDVGTLDEMEPVEVEDAIESEKKAEPDGDGKCE